MKYLYATDEEFEVDPDSGKETLEDEVRSDRLRLLVDENLMTREMKEQAQAEAKVESERDENTGIGGWATVSVSVYNVAGQLVDQVFAGNLSSANHRFTWDAGFMSSGVYFMNIQVDDVLETKKLMLVK